VEVASIAYFKEKLIKMEYHKTVDSYIANSKEWKPFLQKLRQIMLSTAMTETVKWGGPCYTVNGKNVLGIGAFKSFATIWFFQGALLQDKNKVLINAQEGKTKALRQWRFTKMEEINEALILEYVAEAIENQKRGKEIKPPKRKPLIIPQELKDAFTENPAIKTRFDELKLTGQREFAEHISDAKRAETKMKRLEKILPMILEGRGLYDKYKNC
jgi:uncharacterized protein YdeI (YjbR/CyaY-like superfamily)